MGYSTKWLDEFTDGAATSLRTKGMSKTTVDTATKKGYNLKRMDKLTDEGFSVNHMEYYVENDVSLEIVDALRLNGHSIEDIHSFVRFLEEFKKLNAINVDLYGVARDYCTWEKERSAGEEYSTKEFCNSRIISYNITNS